MQVVRTEVVLATSSTGEPVLRVLFCGEGGECVTVDMANADDTADDQAALSRARAILVQTANFSLAANDYDAQSNGNFDELAVTSVHNDNDQLYIFECRDGEGSRRLPSLRMSNVEAARGEAVRCAIDLLTDLQPGTDDLSGWLVRVLNEQGALLCAIDVQEANAAQQANQ